MRDFYYAQKIMNKLEALIIHWRQTTKGITDKVEELEQRIVKLEESNNAEKD